MVCGSGLVVTSRVGCVRYVAPTNHDTELDFRLAAGRCGSKLALGDEMPTPLSRFVARSFGVEG